MDYEVTRTIAVEYVLVTWRFYVSSGDIGLVFLHEPQNIKITNSNLQDKTASQRSLTAQSSLQNMAILTSLARSERQKG